MYEEKRKIMANERLKNLLRFSSRIFVISAIFLSAIFGLWLWQNSAIASTAPQIITYQGKLLVGSSPASSTLAMKFVLYDDLTGGTALYTASGTLPTTSTINVTPTSGLFSVDLGGTGTNSLDPTIFQNNQNVYLEVMVGNQTLSPRKQITAAPYAFNAKYLDGLATSSIAKVATNETISGAWEFLATTTMATTTISKLTINGQGLIISDNNPNITTNALYNVGGSLFWNGSVVSSSGGLPLGADGQILFSAGSTWTATSAISIASTSGKVGIGTTNPGTLLTVHNINIASTTSSTLKQSYLSVDQMALSQLEGGSYFGRTKIINNNWGVEAVDSFQLINKSVFGITGKIVGLAASGDSAITIVAVFGGQLALFNYNTFTAVGTSQLWKDVSVSADGKVMSAVISGAGIHRSTDYGVTWATSSALSKNWTGIALSADGKYQTAVATGDQIYISTDFGMNWTAKDSVRAWTAIAMSSDGKLQLATASSSGSVYLSVDYGSTWTAKAAAGDWSSVAMSDDGRMALAGVNSGSLYRSTDYGYSWATTTAPTGAWTAVGVDAIGKYQLAGIWDGALYVSANYGATWATSTMATSGQWYDIGLSGDALSGVATDYNNGFYSFNNNQFINNAVVIDTTNGQTGYSLTVGGNGYFGGDLVLANSGALTVGGLSLLATTTASGGFTVNGPFTVNNATSSLGVLTAATTSIYGPLTVSSASVSSTISGSFDIGSNLNVTGNTTLGGLTATGASFNTLSVTNAGATSTFNGSMYVGNNLSVNGSFTVMGTSTITSPLIINGANSYLSVIGDTDINGSLTVSGISTTSILIIDGASSYLSVNGSGTSTFNGPVIIGGSSFTVNSGTSTLLGLVAVGASFDTLSVTNVNATSTFDGSMYVGSNLSVNGLFAASGTSTITSPLIINGANSYLSVNGSGTSTFNGPIWAATTTVGAFTVNGTSSIRDLLPQSNLTYNIGSSDYRWSNIWTQYLNVGTSTFSLGGDNGVFHITNQPTGAGTKLFSIDSSTGYIGINSSSPNHRLSVNGDTFIIGDVTATNLIITDNSTLGNATVTTLGVTGDTNLNAVTASGAATFQNTISVSGTSTLATTTISGRLGIGTTTPDQALTVIGNIDNPLNANSGIREIATTSVGGNPASIFVSGRYAYVVNQTSSSISVVDVSKPSAPTQVSVTSIDIPFSSPHSIFVSGRYAYVVSSVPGSDVISVLDVSNPSTPVLVGSASFLGVDTPVSIFVSGRYAYVADNVGNAIVVVDISDPSLPIQIATTSVGSTPQEIFVSGRYAYTANYDDNSISVIDISNPFAPVQIATTSVGSQPLSIFVSGRYAYVGNYGQTISIVDISNPAAPTTTATVNVSYTNQSIFVSGRYAYLANTNNSSISVVDVSDPSAPVQVATTSVGGGPNSIFVSGRYAYTANSTSNTISVVDLSGAEFTTLIAHSAEVGQLQSRNDIIAQGIVGANSLQIGTGGILSNGSLAITATNTYSYFGGGITNVGTVTTTNLTVTGTSTLRHLIPDMTGGTGNMSLYNIGASTTRWSNIWAQYYNVGTSTFRISADNNIFNIASSSGAGTPLFTINASNGYIGINSSTPNYQLSVDGNTFINGNVTSTNLAVTSNSNLNTLSAAGAATFQSTINVTGTSTLATTTISGRLGIGTTTPDQALTVVGNISNLISTNSPAIQVVTTSADLGALSDVYVSGRYAYVTEISADTFAVFDLTNSSAPGFIATTSIALDPVSVAVSGHYAYVISQGTFPDTLSVVDISNPAAPTVVASTSSLSLFVEADDVFVSGRYAYVVQDAKLAIYDISNPLLPTMIASTSPPGYGVHDTVYVSGRYAYVGSGSNNRIFAIDISNPYFPTTTGNAYLGSGNAKSIFVSGRYAYIADYDLNRFLVVDISNPSSLSLTSTVAVGGASTRPQSVFVSGRYAYVVDGATGGGMVIIDISDPTHAFKVSELTIDTSVYSIFVSGRYAYIADLSGKLITVDISGAEFTAIMAHSAEVGQLQSRNDIIAQGIVGANSLQIGIGGIMSNGSITVTATNTHSFFGGGITNSGTVTTTHLIVTGNATFSGNVTLVSSTMSVLNVTGTSTLRHLIPDMTGGTGNMSLYNIGASTTRWSNIWAQYYNVGTSTFRISADNNIFNIASSSGAGTPLFTINASNGYIGINSSTPNYQLSVNGGITNIGTVTTTNLTVTNAALVSGSLSVLDTVTTTNLVVTGNASFSGVSFGSTSSSMSYFSTNQMILAQLEGGPYFGRTLIKQSPWSPANYLNNWQLNSDALPTYITGVAISSDGKFQTAVSYASSRILTSSDYGLTWTSSTPFGAGILFTGTAMSSDGKVQVVGTITGGPGDNIYISTNYGVSWTTSSASIGASAIAISADGRRIIAAGGPDNNSNYLYKSSDRGVSWQTTGEINTWNDVAVSSDGKLVTAVAGNSTDGNLNDYIYISQDYGSTWSTKGVNANWQGIAMSADGRFQTAVRAGVVNYSVDYGFTWATSTISSSSFYRVVMSAEGRVQTVIAGGDQGGDTANYQIYTSVDYGVNFSTSSAPTAGWTSIAMSSDASMQLAGKYAGLTASLYQNYADYYSPNNFGIGTTSPSESLTVVGSGSFSGSVTTTNLTVSGNTNISSLSFLGTSLSFATSTTFLNSVGSFTSSTAFVLNAANYSIASTNTFILSLRSNGSKVFSVSANGDARASGTLYAASNIVGTPGSPGDLAERVDIAADDLAEAGDVVIVDPTSVDTYRRSGGAYETTVAGVISTAPTIIVGNGKTQNTAVMAMVGRVPVKVSAENGLIKRGDLLVTASIAGHAMKYDSTKDDGVNVVGVIGVALDNFDGGSDPIGKIMALVRTGWVNTRNQTLSNIQDGLQQLAASQGVSINQNSNQLSVSDQSGLLTYASGNIDLFGASILNVSSISGVSGRWVIDADGRFISKVDTADGGQKELYGLQSPSLELVFSGESQLIDGRAEVLFDADTSNLIDENQSLKVNITLTSGKTQGVYVESKNNLGFVVRELNDGIGNPSFDWVVMAKRKTTIVAGPALSETGPISAGATTTTFGELNVSSTSTSDTATIITPTSSLELVVPATSTVGQSVTDSINPTVLAPETISDPVIIPDPIIAPEPAPVSDPLPVTDPVPAPVATVEPVVTP